MTKLNTALMCGTALLFAGLASSAIATPVYAWITPTVAIGLIDPTETLKAPADLQGLAMTAKGINDGARLFNEDVAGKMFVITSTDERMDWNKETGTLVGIEDGLIKSGHGLALADDGKQGDLFGMTALAWTISDETSFVTAGYDIEIGNRLPSAQGVLNL